MSICQVAAVYWASLVVQLVKNPPAMQETWFHSWVRKIPWRRDRLPTPVLLGFPGRSHCKEAACNSGDLGLIPGSGRSPGEGKSNPLQYSCLENPHGWKSLAGYSPWGLTSWCQAPPTMGFFHTRMLEWVAISFSRGSSRPRDQTQVS